MAGKTEHEHIKQIVADRLRAVGGSSIVITEVNIREGGKCIGRPDIVMVRPPKVFIVEIKLDQWQITDEVLAQMKVYGAFAYRTYLCLPKKRCSSSPISLCRDRHIGLIAVNIDPDDGPIGLLTTKVQAVWNPSPKKWTELSERLEKLGMESLYFG
ncbi:MAG: hypothetical protein HYU86_05900 [Chloroflexi bacterium]|nr:hypothetical protein [Chloroflexota bacterium]